MLNFEMGPTSNTDSSLFDVCFETIFASFSFNDEVKFWKLGNEVSSQGQFVTQAKSLHDFRLLYNNVNIELRSTRDARFGTSDPYFLIRTALKFNIYIII